MALSKEDLIEKGFESLRTDRGKEIFGLYFLNEMSQEEVRDKLHQKKRARDSQVLYNLVSNYTQAWKKIGYVTEKKVHNPKSKSKFHPYKKVYRATIKPFFDYAQNILFNIPFEEKIKRDQIKIPEKLKKDFKVARLTKEEIEEYKETRFSKIEEEILNYIFSFKEVRGIVSKSEDLFQGITYFLERIFFYETDNDWPHRINHFFRKGFFIKNKSYLSLTKEIYMSRLKEIEEFEKISFKYFRKLRNKIKLISNFSDQEYFDLIVETPLRKYQYMPSLREIKEEKDKIKQGKLIHLWSKLYFFDEIPEGW